MKSEELVLEEIVQFNEGWVGLQGRRLLLTDLSALSQWRKDLYEMIGVEDTRRVLTRFGYFWGGADAAAMQRVFQWNNTKEWIKAGVVLHNLQGIGRARIVKLKMSKDNNDFEMEIAWDNSCEAETYINDFGEAEKGVCKIMMGHISGYVSHCLDRKVYFIEDKCSAKGDRICAATGKPLENWDKSVQNYFKYYENEQIEANIEKLHEEIKRKNRLLKKHRQELAGRKQPQQHFLIGIKSKSFASIMDLSERVAKFDSSVLITGESGVGKEVIANYIHKLSPRMGKSFVAINCGALPDTLLESELFGHTAGAFTGAIRERMGIFEQARGGTIFLDEIGDISPAMQIKLLRVLQEKEIMRLGESVPRKIDVRIIAATNKNLEEAVKNEEYREDLFYRLRVIEIKIPPLRERKDDILELARFFVDRLRTKLHIPKLKLDASCINYLLNYDWPGNVRELENSIEHAAVLCKDCIILPENFPSAIYSNPPIKSLRHFHENKTLAENERDFIYAVLEKTNGNKTEASKILGIGQATLWRKLKEYESPDKIIEDETIDV